MKDPEILERFYNARNLQKRTRLGYKDAVRIYTNFTGYTLHELLTEAETEEEQGIRWKNRKLKKRLLDFRTYLQNNYAVGTAKIHFQRIKAIYTHYEIEIHHLPPISNVNVSQNIVSFKDIPTVDVIKKALQITTPVMKAVILFMSSSGCARRETLNLTIQDFINATKDYHNTDNIHEVLNILKDRNDIIPTFHLRRQKTNKQYFTFCSPEATTAIVSYLISRTNNLTPEMKIFKFNRTYLNSVFKEINDKLGLGKVGRFIRFRSHMLRKFHASQLYNDGMSLEDVDSLQGRGKDSTHSSYFMDDPEKLREKYIEHLNAVTINLDVNNLDLKSPEFVQMETELESKSREVEDLKVLVEKTNNELINRLNRLERETKSKYGYSIDDFELID